jgi:ABC-type nickel/cobalt efflux system permease component RcnA
MKRTRRRRKPAMDFAPRVDAEAWLQEHPDALIDCPHQPGNLRLTREACAKRHQTANQPRWNNLSAEPHAVFMFKMNLIPCRGCQVGARLAAGEVSWRRAAAPRAPSRRGRR